MTFVVVVVLGLCILLRDKMVIHQNQIYATALLNEINESRKFLRNLMEDFNTKFREVKHAKCIVYFSA